MKRPLRIGLIAEGKTELGSSVSVTLTPQMGGRPIDPNSEGALHTLIRRELQQAGLGTCEFVHRHPTTQERKARKLLTGHTVSKQGYLKKIATTWQAHEVDMIVLVIDSDEHVENRQDTMTNALQVINGYRFDEDDQPITDQSVGGLAIKNFETWLLADPKVIKSRLDIEDIKELPDDLETLSADKDADDFAKAILDIAIAKSTYEAEQKSNQRALLVRWDLAKLIDLNTIKARCQQGYAPFISKLLTTTERIHKRCM